MLDENLPTFFLGPNSDGIKHHKSLFLSQHGSDAEPTYALHYLDPASPTAANRYAVALVDAFNPDIVYGEVIAHPNWSQPTLSAEEINRNGGVTPPPQAQLPSQVTIQLYNPDQQVTITQKGGSWGTSAYYDFSMPVVTFRAPSASVLDRSQTDPSMDVSTPRLHFSWRKEGKLSKDLSCVFSGKSTDRAVKAKKKSGSKDPDIAVALFRSSREITLYESNMSRVEIEDSKGLEVVLLLGAVAIRDIFFGQIKDVFHIAPHPRRDSKSRKSPPLVGSSTPAPGQRVQSPHTAVNSVEFVLPAGAGLPPTQAGASYGAVHAQPSVPPRQANGYPANQQPNNPPYNHPNSNHSVAHHNHHHQKPQLTQQHQQNQQPQSQSESQPIDPRKQQAFEAEAARQRKERQKIEESDRRRAQKLAEHEAREQRRRQAEVDRETERLRRKYGTQQQQQPQQQPQHHQHHPQHQHQKPATPNRKAVTGQHASQQHSSSHRQHGQHLSFAQHHHNNQQQQQRRSSAPSGAAGVTGAAGAAGSGGPHLQTKPVQSAVHFQMPHAHNSHHPHQRRPSPGKQQHHGHHSHQRPLGSPYLQVPGSGGGSGGGSNNRPNASLSGFFSSAGVGHGIGSGSGNAGVGGKSSLAAPRKSLFGLRSKSEEQGKLSKKRSSIF